MSDDQENAHLKRIQVGSRRLRLLGLGVKTGLRAASVAVSRSLGKKHSESIYEEVLRSSVDAFVKEVGKMKGGVMKAAQLLSIYGEHFLPEDVNRVLKSLQADSQPVSFSVMQAKIRRALGKELFAAAHIEKTPIGSASLGQVYRLRLPATAGVDGDIALKVQYPKVAKAIQSDLVTLRRLLAVSKMVSDMERFDEVYEEIRSMLMREADYAKELLALEHYGNLLLHTKHLTVPRVFPQYSTPTVLAMSYIAGRRLDDPKLRLLSQKRRNVLALALMRLLFCEIFVWRHVQTDPHVGNFLVQIAEDGFCEDRIVLLDFGAMRKLPKSYVENFRGLAMACLYGRKDQMIQYATKMSFLRSGDTSEMQDLFVKIVLQAVLPFSEEYAGSCEEDGSFTHKDFDWQNNTLVSELSKLARDAVFSFRLRPPPKEAVFVDRKLVGTVTLLKILGAKIGPRSLALHYLEDFSAKDTSIDCVS